MSCVCEAQTKSNTVVTKKQTVAQLDTATVPPKVDKALVTWYNGRTSKCKLPSGITIPAHLIGVAHRTLPLGTLIEFRKNGIKQLAVVNDRGPVQKRFEFDISERLANILKIKREGVSKVEYVIKGIIKKVNIDDINSTGA